MGSQENGCMKTTLDLPDALVKQVKLRALREGRKLKDAVADLLRKGLAAGADAEPESPGPVIRKDKPYTTRERGTRQGYVLEALPLYERIRLAWFPSHMV